MPYIPKDFATPERQRFIKRVSPFHQQEFKIDYQLAWLVSLLFGKPMPHERGAV